MAGMMRWTRDWRNSSQSPASKESIVYSPVTVGGGSVPIGMRAPSGSQPSRPKNTNCAMIASQKTGSASPEIEMNRATWSGSLSRRTEERIPKGIPIKRRHDEGDGAELDGCREVPLQIVAHWPPGRERRAEDRRGARFRT